MAETELRRVLGDADVGPLCLGREAELSELRALYDACVGERTARVAIILGPPGIGTTRLTTELHRRFRTAGIPTFEGVCRDGGSTYQPILDLAHSALAYLGNVLGDLGSESGRLARIAEVAQVLRGQSVLGQSGRPVRGRRGTLQIVRDGDDRRGLFFEEVRHMLAELGRPRPPAILLSDVHLADPATQALIAYLARTLAPAPGLAVDEDFCGLIVATSHADEPPDWATEAAAHVIRLRGLDPEGVRAFLASPAVVDRFLRVSGGLPRRLQSLVENAADAALPDRVADLSPPAARLVRALALFGRPAGATLLERLAARLAVDDESLGSELHAQELASTPLLSRSVVGGELRLGFASSADRQAAARAVHPDEAVRLHRAIGEALLHTGGGEDPAACAEHLLLGQAGEDAVDLALQAGEALERSYAYERAAALYARALAATARPAVAAQLEERLADLYELLGDYARAFDIVTRLCARQPDDAAVQARLGHMHLLRDEFAAARAALAHARDLAAASGALTIETAVMADLAEACFLEGSHDDAIAAARAALERGAGEVHPETIRANISARNTLGKVFLERGDWGHAAHLFGENLDEARLAGLSFEVSRALVNLGVAAIRQGDYAAAEAHYREGLAAAREHGDLRHRAFCLQNLGVLAQWRRDYAAALRYAQEAVQAFKRLGNRPRLGWVAVDLGDLYVDLGDLSRAEAMAELAGRLLGDVAASGAFLQTLRGRIALERGDRARARAILDEALAGATRLGNADAVNYTLLGLARVELGDEDGEAALARLAGVIQPCSPSVLAQLLVLRGEAHLIEGSLEAAQADLVAAERSSAELGDDEVRLRAVALRAQAAERLGDARAAREAARLARDLDAKLRARVPSEFAHAYGREIWRQALAEPRRATTVPPATARPTGTRFPRIVGRGPEIAHVLEMIERVAPHDSLVLIRGESGTGKELVAEAIHDLSPRHGRPFVKVNCGALVETLLLSELFGHERGAFTGAMSRRKGRFELADGGTLFLDEIGDISPQTQVALLRVLQTREFERVGGTQPIRVDVRILCATNRDLEAMVAAGRFREDLYYRLKGIELDLPPLRQRAGDVPELARCFLARVAEERGTVPKQVTPAALEAMCRYPWPGNVRELENVIRSVTLFTDGDDIDIKHLHEYLGAAAVRPAAAVVLRDVPAPVREAQPAAGYYEAISGGISLRELKRKIELECITRALAEAGGNITRAAEKLGMKRPRLSQLLKEHGITTVGKGPEDTP
jgi:DNA-binding NtrC family response regulator/tetratricopeptide (TPR) repeat protein